jgi:NAD(P)-dependent dehydrogenase (short-subunit alcohol dehydrogenase family)
MKSFDGRVVAITGAGSGIGRALAVDLAGRGALLALSDIDPTGLDETVDLVKGAGVGEVRGDVVDVASRDAVESWAADVVAHFGGVNVLVNNAGVAVTGDFGDLAPDDMEWIVGINFWGVVHGTQAFLPHLTASGDGHLVMMSSLFGLMAVPGQSLYIATKFAVRGLAEALREELLVSGAPVGLTVVHPGGVQTNIVRNARISDHESYEATRRLFEDKLARTTPEEAAAVILHGVLRGKPRVLVGADAHVLHHVVRLSGARYQDVVARVSRRTRRRMGQG